VKVEAILDKSNRTERYSVATLLKNQGVDVLIDDNGRLLNLLLA
jgi:hypothetical protein